MVLLRELSCSKTVIQGPSRDSCVSGAWGRHTGFEAIVLGEPSFVIEGAKHPPFVTAKLVELLFPLCAAQAQHGLVRTHELSHLPHAVFPRLAPATPEHHPLVHRSTVAHRPAHALSLLMHGAHSLGAAHDGHRPWLGCRTPGSSWCATYPLSRHLQHDKHVRADQHGPNWPPPLTSWPPPPTSWPPPHLTASTRERAPADAT